MYLYMMEFHHLLRFQWQRALLLAKAIVDVGANARTGGDWSATPRMTLAVIREKARTSSK
jgi:hypothetical protein